VAHQSVFRFNPGWLVRLKSNLLRYGLPFILFEAFSQFYDKVLCVLAILWLGPVWGAVAAMVGALVINAGAYYSAVNWDSKWVGGAGEPGDPNEEAGSVQRLKEYLISKPTTFTARVVYEIKFIGLLILIDPVVVAFIYRQSDNARVSRQDWFMLAKATVVSMIIWLLLIEPLVYIGQVAWNMWGF
jgi:hypothetical protein